MLQPSFVFFNILVILINAILYAAIFFFILRRLRSYPALLAYGIFWAAMALLWILVVVRLLAALAGREDLDRFFFVFAQTFLVIVLPAAAFWGGMNATLGHKTFARALSILVAILSLAFLYFLFSGELREMPTTLWGTKYRPPQLASLFFVLAEAIVTLSVLIAMARQFLFRKNGRMLAAHLGAHGAILLFAAAGFVDELSLTTSGQLIFVRILFILAAITAYISVSAELMREELKMMYAR